MSSDLGKGWRLRGTDVTAGLWGSNEDPILGLTERLSVGALVAGAPTATPRQKRRSAIDPGRRKALPLLHALSTCPIEVDPRISPRT